MNKTITYLLLALVATSIIFSIYVISTRINSSYNSQILQNELGTLNKLTQTPLPQMPNISSKDYIPSDVYYRINSELLNELNKSLVTHPEIKNNVSEYLKNATVNLSSPKGTEYLRKAYSVLYASTMPKDREGNLSYINDLLDAVYNRLLDINSKYSQKLSLAPDNYSPQSCMVIATIDSTLGYALSLVKTDKNFLSSSPSNLGNRDQIIHDIYYKDLPEALTSVKVLNHTISEIPITLLSCYKTIDKLYNKLLNFTQGLLQSTKPQSSFAAIHNYNLSIAGLEWAKEYYPYDRISAIENVLYSLIRLLSLNDLASLTKGSDYIEAINNTNIDSSFLYSSYLNTINYVNIALNYVKDSDVFLKYLIVWLINYDIIGKLTTFRDEIKGLITYGNITSLNDLKWTLAVSYVMGFGPAEVLSKHLIDLINILKGMSK
ncbi:MAG: hypothetical protein QXL96_12025 [Ignisphaera sp.]